MNTGPPAPAACAGIMQSTTAVEGDAPPPPRPCRAAPRPRAICWLGVGREHKTPPAQLTVPLWARGGRIWCCRSHQLQKGAWPPRPSAPGSPQTKPPCRSCQLACLLAGLRQIRRTRLASLRLVGIRAAFGSAVGYISSSSYKRGRVVLPPKSTALMILPSGDHHTAPTMYTA